MALAADQTQYNSSLVYCLFWTETVPYTSRNLYYNFTVTPQVHVDGRKINYTRIVNHSVLPGDINHNSGVILAASYDGSTLNGSVTNTAKRELASLMVRVFRISQADQLDKPNQVTEIIAETPLTPPGALADGAAATFNVTPITLGASERLVVVVQENGTKEVMHALYIPALP